MRNPSLRKLFGVFAFIIFAILLNEHLSAKGFDYKTSSLTDENYSVRLSKTEKHVISCGAVNRKSKPPIFFDITFLGSGSIGFIDVYFSIKALSRVVPVPVIIGNKSMTIQGIASGHIISLGLSEEEISDAVKKGISINKQKIDAVNLSKLYSLATNCLASKK